MTIGRLSLLAGALLAAATGAAAAESLKTAKVTYVTGTSVYVDAGRADGLEPGARLEVFRGDEPIAVLEVRDVSTRRSVCSIVEQSAAPQVDDLVRYAASDSAVEATAARPAPDARRKAGGGLRAAGIRGRVGLRYLWVNDRNEAVGDYSQPALDLRLDSPSVAGSAWGFNVDARARRTYRNLGDGTSDDQGRTRLYRLAVSRTGRDDPWNFTVGRQYSATLAAISLFDGISAEYDRQSWAAGLFSGTLPDPESYAYSGDVVEHGLYLRFNGRPSPERRWQLVTGAVGSYEESEINREFFYVQGRYNGPKLSLYLTEEVDYNRDWKSDEGADTVSLTSSFLTLRYQATGALSLHAGFDNRRRVRLFRDRVTPITEFNDSFREGVWAGAGLRFLERYRLGVDARTNSGGVAGDSDVYTASFSINRLTPWNVNVHTRSSRYTNEQLEGWLHALDLGLNLGQRVYFQLGGGTRSEDSLTTFPPKADLSWYGLDLDVTLGRHWYLLLSAERTDGDLEQVDQYYSTLTYRF